MYVLYYINENYALHTIEVENLNAPILLNEACIFTNIRKGIEFIKEPHQCLKLTDLERLIISTEFFDTSVIKQSDFRKAFTYLENVCQVDEIYPIDYSFEPMIWFNEGLPVLRYNNYQSPHDIYFSVPDGNWERFDKAFWESEDRPTASIVVSQNGDQTNVSYYVVPEFRTDESYNSLKPFRYVYFKDLFTGRKSETYDLSEYFIPKCGVINKYNTETYILNIWLEQGILDANYNNRIIVMIKTPEMQAFESTGGLNPSSYPDIYLGVNNFVSGTEIYIRDAQGVFRNSDIYIVP
nr:hypothetical protein [uncultured Flavobacterium sp.]